MSCWRRRWSSMPWSPASRRGGGRVAGRFVLRQLLGRRGHGSDRPAEESTDSARGERGGDEFAMSVDDAAHSRRATASLGAIGSPDGASPPRSDAVGLCGYVRKGAAKATTLPTVDQVTRSVTALHERRR